MVARLLCLEGRNVSQKITRSVLKIGVVNILNYDELNMEGSLTLWAAGHWTLDHKKY